MNRWILTLFIALSLAPAVRAQEEETQVADPDFSAWCDQSVRTLERARGSAARQVAYGQFAEAAATLKNALDRGIQRPAWNIRPVTWRLMLHGKALGDVLLANATDGRSVRAAVNALESVYDLVIESANEIDRPYYRPRCGYCRGRGVQAFDRRILRMAGDMLALVNGNMTYARRGQVFPVGPARSYLLGAETIAAGAAGEIAELVYAESYGCEIAELDDLVRELDAFNSASSTETERIWMFQDTYSRLDAVIAELRAGRGCRYRRY